MNFSSLASSSAGNCYLVDDGKIKIMLECGLSITQLRYTIGKLSQISACLVTHRHLDHSRFCELLMRYAIDIYGPADLGLGGHRFHPLTGLTNFSIGSFLIIPFPAIHDVECLGYILQSGTEKLLFLVDSAYCPRKINGLTHLAIECNYDRQTLHEAIADGRLSGKEAKRIIANHFGLETVLEMLRVNDLSGLREIHLLHMSDRHGNEERILKSIQELTGIPIYVAEK